jgi:hypothetical protein
MRRPPQPWESKLARLTSIIGGAGVKSSGDGTSGVAPTPTPGTGGGTEPAPVLPPPGAFIAPSTPTLISSVQGINVVWNGLNSAGDLWPSDTSYVEVHMDTSGPTFTVGTATLKGRLARPGGLSVVGLSRGTTYYFRLRGADPAGNVTTAGSAASAQPGQINAPDIAANAITANSIVAGTITGWSINAAYLSGGTISGGYITGGTVSGGFISGGTISGAEFRTGTSGARVTINDSGPVGYVNIYSGNNALHSLYGNLGDLVLSPSSRLVIGTDTQIQGDLSFVTGGIITNTSINNSGTAYVGGKLTVGGAIDATGNIDTAGNLTADRAITEADNIVFQGYRTTATAGDVMLRLNSNVTTTNQAKFQVEADGDVLSRTNSYAGYSDARLKDNISPARDYLQDLRQVEVVTYNWQGSDQKLLGVTAQQLQSIFPSMVAEDDDGTLSVRYSVFVPMLLTAVQSLADKVDNLTARIDALEGN